MTTELRDDPRGSLIVQLHHREATLNRLLAQAKAERDNLREENERLRLVARLASTDHHPPAQIAAP